VNVLLYKIKQSRRGLGKNRLCDQPLYTQRSRIYVFKVVFIGSIKMPDDYCVLKAQKTGRDATIKGDTRVLPPGSC
jgi:hypothetical protein